MRHTTALAPVDAWVVVIEVLLVINAIGCGPHAVWKPLAQSLPQVFHVFSPRQRPSKRDPVAWMAFRTTLLKFWPQQ